MSRLVQAKAAVLEDLEARQSVLFPGAADAIRRLAADGPLAIASGALRAEIFRILIREDLAGYFTLVVAAEDAEASKPSPAPYLKAVAQLARHENRIGRSGWVRGYRGLALGTRVGPPCRIENRRRHPYLLS